MERMQPGVTTAADDFLELWNGCRDFSFHEQALGLLTPEQVRVIKRGNQSGRIGNTQLRIHVVRGAFRVDPVDPAMADVAKRAFIGVSATIARIVTRGILVRSR